MSVHTVSTCGELQDKLDEATEDGAEVVLAFTGDCHLTGPYSWNAPPNSKLHGSNSTSLSSHGEDDVTVFIDDYQSTSPLIDINTPSTGTFELYGFTIKGGDPGNDNNIKSDGVIIFGGTNPNTRVHHIHINGHLYTSYGQRVANSLLKFTNYIRGVVDHCTFNLHSVGNGIKVHYPKYGGTTDNGSASFAAPTGFGSTDFIYIEDCIFEGNSTFSTIDDCLEGGKIAERFNTLHIASTQTHPTSSGSGRGCRGKEVYFNAFNYSEAEMAAHSGNPIAYGNNLDSGVSLVFGNAAPTGYATFQAGHGYRRSDHVSSKSASGAHVQDVPPTGFGFGGPTQQTGTVNVTGGGLTVTKVTGPDFNVNWPAGSMIHIGGTDEAHYYKIASIESISQLTLNTNYNAGSQTGATYYMGSAWDGNTDGLTGYPLLDQPGRGQSDLLTGDFPNMVNGDCTPSATQNCWPNQALEPVYNFRNTWTPVPGYGSNIFDPADVVVINRDYYLEDETNCVAGAACTQGVGHGNTLPTTCATGTGFWKENEGNWRTATPSAGINHTGQGVLYKCTAPNIWTLYYEPLTYPHPLVVGGGSGGGSSTFGYTSIGGSASALTSPACTLFTTTAGGDVTKISSYWSSTSANTIVTSIYSDNAGVPGTKLAESAQTAVLNDGWHDTAISYTVAPATNYFLCAWPSDANSELNYGPGSSGQTQTTDSGIWPTWPTWSPGGSFARQYSINATVVEEGGEVPIAGYSISTNQPAGLFS